MITFDCNAPPYLREARAQRTFVIVRFEPLTDKTTRITLHHTGWGDGGEWDRARTTRARLLSPGESPCACKRPGWGYP